MAFTPEGRETPVRRGRRNAARVGHSSRCVASRDSAHSETATTVSVSSDGALAATGGDDKVVRIWSIETGALVHEELFDSRVAQVRWAPQARRLSVAAGLEIRLLDSIGGKWSARKLEMPRSVDGVALTQTALVVAVGNELQIFDQSDLSRPPQRVALPSASRRLVASGDLVGAVLATGLRVFEIADDARAVGTPADRSPSEDADLNGSMLSVAGSKKAEVWDRASGTSVKIVNIERSLLSSVALDRVRGTRRAGNARRRNSHCAARGEWSRTGAGRQLALCRGRDSGPSGAQSRDVENDGVAASTLTPDEQTLRLPGTILRPRTARWLPRKNHVVADAPLQIYSWNVSRAKVTGQFETTIDTWPLACAPDGRCAWDERNDSSHSVVVRNVAVRTKRFGGSRSVRTRSWRLRSAATARGWPSPSIVLSSGNGAFPLAPSCLRSRSKRESVGLLGIDDGAVAQRRFRARARGAPETSAREPLSCRRTAPRLRTPTCSFEGAPAGDRRSRSGQAH